MRPNLMRSLATAIHVSLLLQVCARDFMDGLVQKLFDQLAEEEPNVFHVYHAALLNTTLGKAGYRALQQHRTYAHSFPLSSEKQRLNPLLYHQGLAQIDNSHNAIFTQHGRRADHLWGRHVFTQAAVDNALMMQDGLPKFSKIEPTHVGPAVQKFLDDMMSEFTALESRLAENKEDKSSLYKSTVENLEKLQFPLSYSWGVVNHLMGVKNSNELRDVHQTMQPKVVEATQRFGQSRPLYDSLCSIRDDASAWKSLTEPQQRIVKSSILSMQQSGVGLDVNQREEFNKLQLESAELSTKFSNHLLDSTKAFKLKITDKEQVKGLPSSALALAAQQSGSEDATPEAGPWTLTLDIPSYLPSMQHLQDRSLREKLYRAFLTRASTGETDNTGVILRILQLRKKMAHILGQKNWAEVSLLKKMAPSVEAVTELSEMLRAKAYPAAQKDLAELQAFAEKEFDFQGPLQLWDIAFYSERLREKRYSFTDEELRPYFPLQEVLKGLFNLANRIFDVRIEATDGEEDVWHPDVQYFKVFDAASNQHIASFFLDPYSRPADKRGGAWMDVCVGKSKVMNRKPVAYLTCNGSPPVGNTPALMTFGEVETLFHEFGHGLQHMLTTVEDGDAAGINGVEWDAVELPSQFMENWCYDESTLMGFAKHYETGEQLPKELFDKIKEAKKFQASMMMLRQLYIGQLDMALHDQFDPDAPGASPFALQKEIADHYTVLKPLPEDRFLCSFGHIFAGGYSAGYYSYKWAEILSADSFAAFEEAGLDNEEEVRRIGRKFRDTVLSMGGGKHPSEVFKQFRGRDPSPEALLRHSGLGAVAIGPQEVLVPAAA